MVAEFLINLAELGLVPDQVVRAGIRRLLSRRLATLANGSQAKEEAKLAEFADRLRQSPLAVETAAANQQHYEVPAEFFRRVLGPRLKYSCCQFSTDLATLAEAEDLMLHETCRRADIQRDLRILDLGCGWGSLTLWIAEHYRGCQITAVSNSASQRRFIEARAREQGFSNVRVITADIRTFDPGERFDRVLSVEMFEHLRNYELLFHRVADWLAPEGKAFVHVFCHRSTPYLFEVNGAANWMGRHFFTGGMMPSENLFAQFQNDLAIESQWQVSGMHYYLTCEHWLKNLDGHRADVLRLFERDLSPMRSRILLQRWRMFFMACAELFRYRSGNEWFVGHYLMKRQAKLTEPVTPDQRLVEIA